MRIVKDDLKEIENVKTSVALGTFDGMHKGHESIIELAKSCAGSRPVLVYTFENIPASYFGKADKAILSNDEKLEMFAKLDIDYLVMVKFDSSIGDMPPRKFLDYVRLELDAEVICCGFNYTFGKNAEGNPELLMKYAHETGITAAVAEPVLLDGNPVSSTRIRAALREGDITTANAMLGKKYYLNGNVVEGKHLGGRLGYPTANLMFPPEKLVPRHGVYATATRIGEAVYPSVTNIGVRPTVESTGEANAETFIIGHDEKLYGREITVDFLDFLRPEIKFGSTEELAAQIDRDRESALQKYFSVLL